MPAKEVVTWDRKVVLVEKGIVLVLMEKAEALARKVTDPPLAVKVTDHELREIAQVERETVRVVKVIAHVRTEKAAALVPMVPRRELADDSTLMNSGSSWTRTATAASRRKRLLNA